MLSRKLFSEQFSHVLVVKNRVPLWMDGDIWDYHYPPIYLRCGVKNKLTHRDFSASALMTKVDLGARSFSVVGPFVPVGCLLASLASTH